jgi:hypothetical protein
MLSNFLITYSVVGICAALYTIFKKKSYIFGLAGAAALLYLSSVRPPYISDYQTYLTYFAAVLEGNHTSSSLDLGRLIVFIEPGFIWLTKIGGSLKLKGEGIFFAFSLFGVLTKIYIFEKYSALSSRVFLLYFATYFVLYELVQIRMGIAASILYASIFMFYYDRRVFLFVSIMFASLIHIASIAFLPLLIIPKYKKINIPIFLGAVFVSYIIYLTGLDPISLFSSIIVNVQGKAGYLTGESGVEFSVLNPFVLMKIFVGVVILYFKSHIVSNQKSGLILINTYLIGCCTYVALGKYPEIAVRISYLFLFSELFLLPSLFSILRPIFAANFLFITYCFLWIYINFNVLHYFSQ